MAKLTSYLYSLGHRRLGFLAHHATLGPVNERQTSVVAAARRHQGVLVATAADADSLEGGVAPLARCWMLATTTALARDAEIFGVFLKHRDAVTRVTFWG